MDLFEILEIGGVVAGILFLVLVIRERVLAWPFGILASAVTVVLYLHHKLYLEAGLNVYYIAAGIYGWIFWSRHLNAERKTPVSDWPLKYHALTVPAGLLLSLALGTLMLRYTDSPRPFVDAGLTVFSFLATYMEARKVLSTWHYWFLINGTTVWLQLDRGLYWYAALSVFYTLMCIRGYQEWKKSRLQEQQANS